MLTAKVAPGRDTRSTSNVTRVFHRALQQAGLKRVHIHDLRHTAASLQLARGENPKVVQELLGHSQIAVTMDIYSHALPTMQREAMDDLNRLLSA